VEDLGPIPSPMIPYLSPPPTPSQQMGGAEADRNATLHGGPRRPRNGAHQNHGTQRTPSTVTSTEEDEEDYYSDDPASEDLISIGLAPWLPPTGASSVSESIRSELLLHSPAFQPTPPSQPPMAAPVVEERQFPVHPHPSQSTVSDSKGSSPIYSGHYSSDGRVSEADAMPNTRIRSPYSTPSQEDVRMSPYGVLEEKRERHRASPYPSYSQLSRREIIRRMDVIEEEKESLSRRDIQRRRDLLRSPMIEEDKGNEDVSSNALPFFDRWAYNADPESEDDGSRVVWGEQAPPRRVPSDTDARFRRLPRYRDLLGRGGGPGVFDRRS
jgi:hypothetical protein